jgi:putative membrane protein
VSGELRLFRTMVAVAIACATIGCKRRQDAGAASLGDSTVTSIGSDTGTSSAAAPGGLSDANIAYLLDEANMGDSAAGAYAVSKATSADVKAFARLMMGEHHALRAQGQQLAQKLNLTMERPANDPVQTAALSEMAALQGATKLSGFDSTYIDQEIGVHRAVLDLGAKAHDAAQSPELKKLIEQAKPVIQKHLDRAEQIQKKLAKPST